MWLDEWIRGNKKKVAILVVLVLTVAFFWYLLFPYPTLNMVEFVHIEIDITLNETEPDVRVPADFGPHCAEVRILGGLVVVDNDVLSRATQVVVLIDYEMNNDNLRAFSWNGDGLKHYLIERSSTYFRLVSPVHENLTLLEIYIEGDELWIDDRTISPGQEWEGTFKYPAMDERYIVTEVVVLENVGHKIAFAKRTWPCD